MTSEFINKIICGDCLELMNNIPNNSIDMILTDPPYGINFLSPYSKNHTFIKNDNLDDWLKMLPKMFEQFKRIITDTGVCCCFCGGGGKTPVTALFTVEAIKYFNLIQTVVWKKFIGLGWKWRPAYENIVILSKSKDNYNFYDTSNNLANVITGINQAIPQADEHPTPKPLALMEKLILIHSEKGMTVLDPFMGFGTTCLAAKNLKRNFIGIEIEPKYYEMARNRIYGELFKN